MVRISTGAAAIILAVTAAPILARDVRVPMPELAPSQVETHLAHRGLVLDVRAAGECDLTLASATHRVAFAPVGGDAAIREASVEFFVADVRRQRTFVQAQRNQTPILVVCCGGVRSAQAAKELAARGFNVRALAGGVQNAAMPVHLIAKR